MISQIRKRDGRVVPFDQSKITDAIWKAMQAAGENDRLAAQKCADRVVSILQEELKIGEIAGVEHVQDIVERVLIEEGHTKTAKSYILYRQKRAEIREAKASLGVEDDLKLPLNAITVLAARYLRRDENRKIIETPRQLFRRVARAIAESDRLYGATDEQVARTEEEFYEMMTNFEFLPNSPTLMNAGTKLGQLSACFVLPIGDSMEEIFESVKNTALVHKTGGGTGFSFSRLRPKGDVVLATGGVASGPISFMTVFDAAANVIKQGGKRRGANMGVLRVDHPDILDFIVCKEKEGMLSNFNISVAITDKFMDAVINDKEYELINPRNGKVHNRLKARIVWNLIVTMAWKTGDPGVLFIDRINQTASNPVPELGPVESTNPCGEQPLYPYDSCNLGSINLAKMVRIGDNGKPEVDWSKLQQTVRKGVHFLDNVIDANKYPILEIELMTKSIRRIGLGVMGWADMLIQLGIPYNSMTALKLAETVMRFISEEGRKMSVELAKERGSFPRFKGSIWEKMGYECMRNATVTTIAPTGTIGVIAGVSSGIEPLFAVAYMRNVGDTLGVGKNLIEINPLFERIAIKEGFYSDELMRKVSRCWSLQNITEIPENVRKIFVTAHDVTPEWHVRMQAAFQKYVDNAVSKTINFPSIATPYDVEKAYVLAYQLGCKGITIYRDGSKSVQIITPVNQAEQSANMASASEGAIKVSAEFSGGCSTCGV
ncbi:MAG: vitamin B12-dependent ribonucleotide reductase [Candidatus Aenigmatarchaeota archaeon]